MEFTLTAEEFKELKEILTHISYNANVVTVRVNARNLLKIFTEGNKDGRLESVQPTIERLQSRRYSV